MPTKKAVVEEALRRLVRGERQAQALRELTGIRWEGDLDKMRTDIDDPYLGQAKEPE
jgi:Arc/MetJ family transcription regulator